MFATKKQTFQDKIQTGSATMKTGNGLFSTQKSRNLLKRGLEDSSFFALKPLNSLSYAPT